MGRIVLHGAGAADGADGAEAVRRFVRVRLGIEVNGRLLRVQTKSTTFQRGGTFTCNLVGPGGRAYREGTIDYFAVYLIPVDLWYILPFEKTRKTSVSLQFTPTKAGHNYEVYREAWHLLREAL